MKWHLVMLAKAFLPGTLSLQVSTVTAQSPDPFQTVLPQRPPPAHQMTPGEKPSTTKTVPFKREGREPSQVTPTQPGVMLPELFGVRPETDFQSLVDTGGYNRSPIIFTGENELAWKCKSVSWQPVPSETGNVCIVPYKPDHPNHGKVALVGFIYRSFYMNERERNSSLRNCEASFQELLSVARKFSLSRESAWSTSYDASKFQTGYIIGINFKAENWTAYVREFTTKNKDLDVITALKSNDFDKNASACSSTMIIEKRVVN